MNLLNRLSGLVEIGKNIIPLVFYDRWTIASYFRKQGAQIGQGCSIMVRSLGTEPYLVRIGDRVGISRGVVFATHEGAARLLQTESPGLQVFGPIVIEDDCLIGENVFLSPNIRIGSNSIIGANSVVISDIPPDRIAMGVPARVIGSTEKLKDKCRELWKVQKPPGMIIEDGVDIFHSKFYKTNRRLLKQHLIDLYGNVKPGMRSAGEDKTPKSDSNTKNQ